MVANIKSLFVRDTNRRLMSILYCDGTIPVKCPMYFKRTMISFNKYFTDLTYNMVPIFEHDAIIQSIILYITLALRLVTTLHASKALRRTTLCSLSSALSDRVSFETNSCLQQGHSSW